LDPDERNQRPAVDGQEDLWQNGEEGGWKEMELGQFFQSIVEQDTSPIVICNLEHEIIYMNPAAVKRHQGRGGEKLVGKSLLSCHNEDSREKIRKVTEWFRDSREHNLIYTSRNDKENKDIYMVALRDGEGTLIGYYEKHEYRDRETKGMYCFGE